MTHRPEAVRISPTGDRRTLGVTEYQSVQHTGRIDDGAVDGNHGEETSGRRSGHPVGSGNGATSDGVVATTPTRGRMVDEDAERLVTVYAPIVSPGESLVPRD